MQIILTGGVSFWSTSATGTRCTAQWQSAVPPTHSPHGLQSGSCWSRLIRARRCSMASNTVFGGARPRLNVGSARRASSKKRSPAACRGALCRRHRGTACGGGRSCRARSRASGSPGACSMPSTKQRRTAIASSPRPHRAGDRGRTAPSPAGRCRGSACGGTRAHDASNTYRIALGPQQGRKVFTLQTLPASEDDLPSTVAKEAAFSLHAGVARVRRAQTRRITRTGDSG